jgi:prevent-host-death family protein
MNYHDNDNIMRKFTTRGKVMTKIRPIPDLRNHFAEISKFVHETFEPVFLTKNGHGDMIVMSMEYYEKLKLESEMYHKLKEKLRGNEEKK